MNTFTTITALLVFLALAATSPLANAAPARRALCTFISYKTFQKLELLEDGSVTALGQDRGATTEFDLTTLPQLYHVHIMRYDSDTYLVYNNGNFSHGTPQDDNHVFLVEYTSDGQAITLKAVNHKYNSTEEAELGSGVEEEGREEEEEEGVGVLQEVEMMGMDKDCYLGFTEEGKPMCYSSKLSENGSPLFEVRFFTPCYN